MKYYKLIDYFEQGKTNVCLAVEGKRVLGYAQYFRTDYGRVHLNEIAVAEEYQYQGIGTKLMEEVEKGSRKVSVSCIELFCIEKNERAKTFYSKNNYETEKRLMIKRL